MITLKRTYRYKGYIFGDVYIDGELKFHCIEKYFNHLPEGAYSLKVLNQTPQGTFAKFKIDGKKTGSLNPEDDLFFGKELRYCYVDDIFEWAHKNELLKGVDDTQFTIEGKPKVVDKKVIFDQEYFNKVTKFTRYKRYE